jgi:hypothetical protein
VYEAACAGRALAAEMRRAMRAAALAVANRNLRCKMPSVTSPRYVAAPKGHESVNIPGNANTFGPSGQEIEASKKPSPENRLRVIMCHDVRYPQWDAG